MDDQFAALLDSLTHGNLDTHALSEPFVRFLPISGAAVSTLGPLLGTETVSASDQRAARLDEIQFDVGEGPCWDAYRHAAPVSVGDLLAEGRARWPAFFDAVHDDQVRAIFAYPLSIGTLRLGAVDLYATRPMTLSRADGVRVSALADAVSRNILREALEAGSHDTDLNPLTRRTVHHATGIVLAQLGVTPEDAHLVIQGHAFATGESMIEVAERILDGRLRFLRRDGRIEVADD